MNPNGVPSFGFNLPPMDKTKSRDQLIEHFKLDCASF